MASSDPPPRPQPLSPIYSLPSSPQEHAVFEPESAVDKVNALLRQLLRVAVTDGRIFIGTFAGTDKPLNIILVNAEEFGVGPGHNAEGRYVGQIMIPWKIIVKVEANVEKSKPTPEMYMWCVVKCL